MLKTVPLLCIFPLPPPVLTEDATERRSPVAFALRFLPFSLSASSSTAQVFGGNYKMPRPASVHSLTPTLVGTAPHDPHEKDSDHKHGKHDIETGSINQ